MDILDSTLTYEQTHDHSPAGTARRTSDAQRKASTNPAYWALGLSARCDLASMGLRHAFEDTADVPVPCLRYKGTMKDGTEVAIKARLYACIASA